MSEHIRCDHCKEEFAPEVLVVLAPPSGHGVDLRSVHRNHASSSHRGTAALIADAEYKPI
ncbi:hypothetical protein [Bradyrhizobium ganzhouense]|uniref:hypothetical protein n=1 Tax=Bradyrhizobium ganzhouense TaxID=1179767 RepID=UPI003CF9210D